MRRTILPCVVVLLALGLAVPAATAIPEPKGCPAEESIWTEVDYVTEGNFKATGLYDWYWNVGDGAAIEALRDLTGETDRQIYFGAAEWLATVVDRNADLGVCVWWLGGNPGQFDAVVSAVDNNSNANQ